jgi:hypothetical protein
MPGTVPTRGLAPEPFSGSETDRPVVELVETP